MVLLSPDVVSKSGNEISLKFNPHMKITSVGGLPSCLLFKDKTAFLIKKSEHFLSAPVIIICESNGFYILFRIVIFCDINGKYEGCLLKLRGNTLLQEPKN